MPVCLVTYDMNVPGNDYEGLLKTIKNYAWARLSESSYAIETYETPQQVFDKLRPLLDQHNNLYVINLKKHFVGYGPQDVNDWLEKKLNY